MLAEEVSLPRLGKSCMRRRQEAIWVATFVLFVVMFTWIHRFVLLPSIVVLSHAFFTPE
jgi:hypothetical protein